MQRLADGGPSAKAGVEVGDIIVSVGNKPVKGQIFLPKLWATGGPGTEISLGVLKPEKGLQTLPVTAEGPVSLAADVARKLGPFGLFVTRGEDCTAVRHHNVPLMHDAFIMIGIVDHCNMTLTFRLGSPHGDAEVLFLLHFRRIKAGNILRVQESVDLKLSVPSAASEKKVLTSFAELTICSLAS